MSEENKEQKSKGQWHGGKGSVQKPSDQDKYAENWDKIFGKKKTLSKREQVLLNPKLYYNKNDKDSGSPQGPEGTYTDDAKPTPGAKGD